MIILAQAVLEKISLDSMSAGIAQFRYHAGEWLQDDRVLIAIAAGVVLVLFWRMRR